ncbi:hypothetical protein AB6A40_001037 [Gnathostoma spinigerum]|uniref:Succinate dehydrogenase assembly factor 3 n=1 Tax=Gnathostoma spinigerum TaxID=75299 RepID=A0ABD6E3F5_9BILA
MGRLKAAFDATKALKPELFPLVLYKRILRLHYGLPKELKEIGDAYVKEEFRLHKKAEPGQALVFLKGWTDYCTDLSKQLSQNGIVKGELGKKLDPSMLDDFKDEQLRQLLDLKSEAEKPKFFQP